MELTNVDLLKYIKDNNLDIKYVKQFENEYIGNGAFVYCTNEINIGG